MNRKTLKDKTTVIDASSTTPRDPAMKVIKWEAQRDEQIMKVDDIESIRYLSKP